MTLEAARCTEDLEELLAGARGGSSGQYFGPQHHARLARGIMLESTEGHLSSSDFAVLLRAVVREASVQSHRDGIWVPEQRMARLGASQLQRHGIQIAHRATGRIRVRALPWRPGWLLDPGADELEARLFLPDAVRQDRPVDADPVLLRLGYRNYSSDAQREAVRTVLGARPGSTVIVLLPTGSGKTVCGLLPALLPLEVDGSVEGDRFGVTPFVVPTISLALDLERRVSEAGLIHHRTAWRPDLDDSKDVLARIRGGTQGPLFASPEAVVGSLRKALIDAASKGYVRFFVVDEAHMVATWGDEFRPAFQELATVCRELREATAAPFVTVLMSATVAAHALDTIRDLFDVGSGFHIVHAVRLRPEPQFVWQRAAGLNDQREWMRDAIAHLPRPAILYTTRRTDAIWWRRDLGKLGYKRLGLIHGGTSRSDRDRTLDDWRSDSIDLMVATSAFGLGVDKPDVRAVLHATFPETLDRYYQDVGRGGRDGRPSIALMTWTNADQKRARRLARPTFIGTERGNERWRAMFTAHDRESLGDGVFSIPTDVSPSTRPEDIDMQSDENERWNQRTLLLLQRSDALTLLGRADQADDTVGRRRFVLVRVTEARHLEEAFWEEHVLPRRRDLLAAYDQGWQLMLRAVAAEQCLAFALQEQYTVEDPSVVVVRACGSCPHCRSHGHPPTAGLLRVRHAACAAMPCHMETCAEPLRDVLGSADRGFVFVEPSEEAPDELAELADWFVRHGLHDFVLPQHLREAWLDHFGQSENPEVFFHKDRVRGIRHRHPVAAFFPDDEIGEFTHGSILILRSDDRQVGRVDRRLADVVSEPAWPLRQFMDRFVE